MLGDSHHDRAWGGEFDRGRALLEHLGLEEMATWLAGRQGEGIRAETAAGVQQKPCRAQEGGSHLSITRGLRNRFSSKHPCLIGPRHSRGGVSRRLAFLWTGTF